MNVITVAGCVVDTPKCRDTPEGTVCQFGLAIDGQPWLDLTVQASGCLALQCAEVVAAGHRVVVTATVRHDGWAIRDGQGPARWRVSAIEVTNVATSTDQGH